MKIYFTFANDQREGYEAKVPLTTADIPAESVEDIQGQNVLERLPRLQDFIEECYRLLKPGGVAIFSAPHFGSSHAWQSPLNIRGISELSLNFASKSWREQNKYSDTIVTCDFEVAGSFAVEQSFSCRSDEFRGFAMKHYNNVAQAILFTLTKK